MSVLFASPTVEAAPRSFIVEIEAFQFQPNTLRVDPGDVVTIHVFNNDTTGHTFTIVEFDGVDIGLADSPLGASQNATATFTADREGVFWFYCAVTGHATRSGSGWSGMAGRLIVGNPPQADLTVPILAGVGVAIAAALAAFIVLRSRKRAKP